MRIQTYFELVSGGQPVLTTLDLAKTRNQWYLRAQTELVDNTVISKRTTDAPSRLGSVLILRNPREFLRNSIDFIVDFMQ